MNSLSAGFKVKDIDVECSSKNLKQWVPSFNIQPLMKLPVIMGITRTAESVTWGFEEAGREYKTLYVKSSVAHSANSFRLSYRQNRCAILIDSFYAWDNRRVPRRYFIEGKKIIYAAGLFVPKFQSVVVLYRYAKSSTIKHPIVLDEISLKAWLGNYCHISDLIKIIEDTEIPNYQTHLVSNKIFVDGYNNAELHSYTPFHYDLFQAVS